MVSLMTVFSLSARTLYLAPNANWKTANARFAVYAFDNGEAWVSMDTVAGEAGLYQATVDDKYPKVIFCRMNPATAENNWDNKWNQTSDLTLEEGKDLYTIAEGAWDNAGTWSKYTPAGGGEDPITPPTPAIPTVTVIGSMTNWETEIPFELAADSLSASLYNDNIKAGTYAFKMKIGGEWRSNGYTYHRGFTGAAGITGNEGDMKFTADIEGAYKFTWTFANDSLGFEYPALPVVIPAKFYVTGDSALVDTLAWQSNAIKSESDTLVLKLAAGSYALKVTVDGTWSTAKGYSDLTVKADGLSSDKDNNIHFTLAEAGEVKFIYTNELFKLEGNFYAAPVAKFWVAGGEDIVGKGNATWDKAGALVSYKDTLVLNLAAGAHEFKLITANDEWWGYEHLTDTAAGIYTNDYTNVCFKLAEAGEVKVIYTGEVFKVEGKFYIAPAAKYYVLGDSALVVNAGLTADKAWTPDAIVATNDTLVLNLAAGDYTMRLSLYGGWDNNKGFESLTEVAAGLREYVDEYNNHNIIFTLAEAGVVKVIYTGEVFKLEGNFYVAPVAPTAKYYITGNSALVGKALEWNAAAIKVMADEYVFENLVAGDYKLKVTVNGDWATAKGYTDLTNKAEGLSKDNDNNIVFTLAEAGNVTVVYNDSVFTVSGKFYVAPVVVNYYAKYADAEGQWNWHALKEVEGKWLTDTIVYYGTGMNIHSAQDGEGKYFAEIAGVAAKDTAYFTFNPADSTLAATVVGKYVAPVDPKYYITGDSALVGAELKWNPAAIKVMEDTYVFKNLAAGDYKLKVTLDGTWNTAIGYDSLTVKAEGLSADNDNNICFKLAEAGNVTVVYNDTVFTVSGKFYVEPIIPEVKKELKLVPGVWATDSAVLAAWAWGTEAEGAWSAFEGAGDTLIAKVNEKADSVVFVRFAKNAAIDWASNVWNRYDAAIDSCGILFVNDWDNYTWCEAATPEPPVEKAKYYITGDSALVGAELKWNPAAIKVMEDTYVFKNLAAGDYKLKVTLDGTWSTAIGYDSLTVKAEGLSADNDNNIVFTLAEAGNVTVVYNDSVFTVSGNFYVEPVIGPTLTNGYYLVGTMNEWTPAAANLFAENTETAGEYMLSINLTAGDSIKVVYVENDAIKTWYPENAGNYVVDVNHAGATTMYFRPEYQGGEDWYAGCIYVVPTGTVDVQNIDVDAKAVKVVREGQVVIIRGEHTYTVMGQMIK